MDQLNNSGNDNQNRAELGLMVKDASLKFKILRLALYDYFEFQAFRSNCFKIYNKKISFDKFCK